MIFGFIMTAILIGIFMPVQAGLNAELARNLKNPLLSILLSLGTGAIVIFIILLFKGGFQDFKRLPEISPHLFLGGLLGVIFVGSSIFFVPRLGATAMIGAFITGQLIGSVLIDHFGLFNLPIYPINLARMSGIFLLFVGVLLVIKKA